MKSMFDQVKVGGLELRNRLIRSATFEYAADADGRYTETFARIYGDLARGGAGAIITGMVGVDTQSRLTDSMVKAYDPAFVPGLRKLADLVHGLGAKLIVQLAHCGVKVTQLDDPNVANQPLGPSAVEVPPAKPARAMSQEEIKALADSFAMAALKCKEAGADAVQLHCAHGYLLSQFLSPFFNRRGDEYGGDIMGRGRAALEVYEAVRLAVGDDYPVWAKVNCKDFTEVGTGTEEYFRFSAELAARGLNAIELSAGLGMDAKSTSAQKVASEADEGVLAKEALALADQLDIDVVSVCGYRSPDVIESWLNRGRLAGISLCRPLITEPDLISRWQAGDRRKSRCISCNKCFRSKGSISCQIDFEKLS